MFAILYATTDVVIDIERWKKSGLIRSKRKRFLIDTIRLDHRCDFIFWCVEVGTALRHGLGTTPRWSLSLELSIVGLRPYATSGVDGYTAGSFEVLLVMIFSTLPRCIQWWILVARILVASMSPDKHKWLQTWRHWKVPLSKWKVASVKGGIPSKGTRGWFYVQLVFVVALVKESRTWRQAQAMQIGLAKPCQRWES